MKKSDIGKFIVLNIIDDAPMHGYGINHFLEASGFQNFMGISTASIYNSLKWVVENGMATSEFEVSMDSPNKTMYYITEKGKERLKKYIEEILIEYTFDTKNLFHLALRKIYLLDDDYALELLDKKHNIIVKLKENILNNVDRVYNKDIPPFVQINVEFVQEHFGAEIHFIEKIIEYIKTNGTVNIEKEIKFNMEKTL